MLHVYAVKYLDDNGYTISYGYIMTMLTLKPGQVIRHMGQNILIDFEV